MKRIKNLDQLIQKMNPELADKEYVFCTLSKNKLSKLQLKPLLIYKEKEGQTTIIERKIAAANSLPHSKVWKLVTLNVHSDLSAVGFLARITSQLAKARICVNVVSAYYHDHLFVPIEKTEETMKILKKLSKS